MRSNHALSTLATSSALATFALLASCGQYNPFVVQDADHGKKTPAERLREIESTRFENLRKPTPEKPSAAQTAAEVEAARKRFEGMEKVELALDECRASAFEHNLDLKTVLIDPAIARESESAEEARFESAFTLRAAYSDLDQPTASTLNAAQSKNLQVIPGVRVPLLTGGTANVTLPMSRSENNNSFSTLNPAYTSDLQFSISQPLLRGAGRRAATAALRIAGYNRQASEAQTKLEVIRQLAAADRAYWRLYQARGELQVRQQQYEVAVAQLNTSERKVRAGSAAEIEVIRAQAGIADRLEAIIVAQNAVLDRQRELKRIINLPGLEVDTKAMIATKTQPDPVEFVFDRDMLVTQAIANRMEMLALELQLAADAATIAFNKNQALPLLTLDYTYRINGLGDTLGHSFHTMQRNNYEDWEVGLNAEIPLGNEAAKAQVRQSILRRLARLSTKESRVLSIKQEALAAMDSIEAGWQRILAARQSVILNTRALQAEQRQFDVGTSTSTNVLDAAARLADAQTTEVRALADYQIAQVDLAFATGTLLGAGKVRWEPAPQPVSSEEAPPEVVPEMVNKALDKR